jgi:hypothetical protein
MSDIDDMRILLETARPLVPVALRLNLDLLLTSSVSVDSYTSSLDAAINAWENRFRRSRGRSGGRPHHVRLYPKDQKDHRELLRPLLRVLVAEFPQVRFFWLKTGVSLVVGERMVLCFEELETDGELVVGVCGFHPSLTDEDIKEKVPAEFRERKEVRGGRYAGRRCIHPVSMQDFISLIRSCDVGLLPETAF